MSENFWDELESAVEAEKVAKEKGVSEGTISTVEFKTLGDVYDAEILQKWDRDPDIPVVVITIATGWGETVSAVYTKSKHPRSNLRKFFIRYGKPEPGKMVQLKYDVAKERWTVLL